MTDPDRAIREVGRKVAELRAALGVTQAAFAERVGVAAKYFQRIELGRENLTLRTLVRLAAALGVPTRDLLDAPKMSVVRRGRPPSLRVVDEIGPSARYKTHAPVVSLKAAASAWATGRAVEIEGWMKIPSRRRITKETFVARAVGRSMEPKVHDGDWCLFRSTPKDPFGRIVLVEHRALHDPDTGGSYAIKRLAKRTARDRSKKIVRLEPLNPDFDPIELSIEVRDVRVVAVLVDVLGPSK